MHMYTIFTGHQLVISITGHQLRVQTTMPSFLTLVHAVLDFQHSLPILS
jgi:hypothetical protein